ncbi:hypothetical protein [Orientia tsutsugamushi]|uniref:hypothetical protein n=1 Tax=Orientia tsutsugamushi TaxID=784 RepID=UPI000D5A317A|nr:Uncharacterised protein [Orientia tsutsugamushi]SPR13612.1 Uncharacterised protein [Orientia tsutsugamushi]
MLSKDIKNANDTVALLEKQHKNFINRIVARISAEEALKDAFVNYNVLHLVTWKGNEIPVTKSELWMTLVLNKIGAGDIPRRYFDNLAGIYKIANSNVKFGR